MYRDINDFKKGYQPRTNVVKNEKGDLFTETYRILARWRNHLFQLLNVHGFNDDRQTEIHTEEPGVPESSAFEEELAIEKLKSHKLAGTDQIPTEIIKAEGRTIRYEVHKLIISIWNKEELPKEWKELIIVPIYKKGYKTDLVTIGAYQFVGRGRADHDQQHCYYQAPTVNQRLLLQLL